MNVARAAELRERVVNSPRDAFRAYTHSIHPARHNLSTRIYAREMALNVALRASLEPAAGITKVYIFVAP